MSSGLHNPFQPGTFEYIEASIRNDARGNEFGDDFEWLCKWFLEHAPRFRGIQFKKVWLWDDWPDRWGPDAGIDIVALTRAGDLCAVQSKADAPHRSIRKAEIDSFLSESSRDVFAYRLLIGTTDKIGTTARRTIVGQQKPVGLILRSDLLSEQLAWPTEIGEPANPLARWKPRPRSARTRDPGGPFIRWIAAFLVLALIRLARRLSSQPLRRMGVCKTRSSLPTSRITSMPW